MGEEMRGDVKMDRLPSRDRKSSSRKKGRREGRKHAGKRNFRDRETRRRCENLHG